MKKIDIIGQGNVGSHLYKAFAGKADVVNVNSRTLSELRFDADLYIIAVSDNAIANVAERIAGTVRNGSLVAHTSGTMTIDILDGHDFRIGVFYPLQTFSKNVNLDYQKIPIFIEAQNESDLKELSSIAALISRNVVRMDSERRKDLHIASVLSCNFVNHLWTLADKYLEEKGIDFTLLRPLIEETVRKLEHCSPFESQTGPAVRHDSKTIRSHTDRLSDHPEILKLYKDLTDSIELNHP